MERRQPTPTTKSVRFSVATNGNFTVATNIPTHDFPAPPPPVKGPRAVRIGNTAGWVFTRHESRIMVFPVPPATPKRATPSPPNGFSRITSHESRNTAFFAVGAQGALNRKPPPGPPRTPPGRRFPARCGAAWGGYGAAWVAYLSPSRCPRAVRCEIPVMCTKSRFPQKNARSAAFAAAPFALGAQPAEVDPNGRTAPGSAAKSPLIRVDSCPFVVNELMLRKANVLYCIDRLFDKRAPSGSRGFRGECRAGWSGRASSSERKSHVPR